MAVEAVQSCIFEMLFVVELNGLYMIYAFRTAGYDECTEDRDAYGVRGGMLSHGSSMGFWHILSLDNAYRLLIL